MADAAPRDRLVISISSATVCVPSPMTCAGTRSATADDLIVDDEDAVVLAGDERLHDDVAGTALALAAGKASLHGGFIGEIDHHAAAVIAVQRLQHDRVADAPRDVDGLVGGADDLRAARGCRRAEQPRGQLLVAGDVDGEGVVLVTVAQTRFW